MRLKKTYSTDITTWGYKTFSSVTSTNDHWIYVKPIFSNIGDSIASIMSLENFFEGHNNLVPIEDQIDEEDINTVKVFDLCQKNLSLTLVSKIIHKKRVPSIFHEPYVCHILNQQGINVPNIIGVCEAKTKNNQLNNYLIMGLIPNSFSLYQIYRKRNRLKELLSATGCDEYSSSQIKRYYHNIIKKFGVEVHKLFLTGIIHMELDMKNVCLSLNPDPHLFFLDFERTRVTYNACNSQKIRSAYKESIPRRLKRYKLPESNKQLFADGYVTVDPKLYIKDLLNLIIELRRNSEQPYLMIAIDGFAGAGKTVLAQYIASHIDNVTILETDMFMKYSRKERNLTLERFIDHRGWYDTHSLAHLLTRLLDKTLGAHETIRNLYNHSSGEKDKVLDLTLEPGCTLLIEGMYALTSEIRRHCSLSILLTAKHKVLFNRVYSRDTQQRQIPDHLITKRYKTINGSSYRSFFQSHQPKADLCLDTSEGNRSYSIRKVNYTLLPFFLNCGN